MTEKKSRKPQIAGPIGGRALEGWWTPKKGIITNGDLEINGKPKIMGILGGVHTNQDLEVSGNPGIQMVDGLTASNKTINDGGTQDGLEISGTPCIGSAACANPPGQQPEANKTELH